MNLYIAAPWKDRNYAQEVAERFKSAGHTISYEWWRFEDKNEARHLNSLTDHYSHEFLCRQAAADIKGVTACDILVLLDTQKSEGKAVEQGLALGMGKPILAIGKLGSQSLNVFHHLPAYQWVETLDEALLALCSYSMLTLTEETQ